MAAFSSTKFRHLHQGHHSGSWPRRQGFGGRLTGPICETSLLPLSARLKATTTLMAKRLGGLAGFDELGDALMSNRRKPCIICKPDDRPVQEVDFRLSNSLQVLKH